MATPWTEQLEDTMTQFLARQSALVHAAIYENGKTDKTAAQFGIVLLAAAQTLAAMNEIARHRLLNEFIMLGRALLERLVNYCYLLVCDENEREKYRKHTLQKGYRKLSREVRAGVKNIKLEFSAIPDPDSIPDLKAALDEFTSERGREKTRWTNATIPDRLEKIEAHGVISIDIFLITFLQVYEDASEALHGTYYGCSFHTAAYLPGDPSTLKERAQENLLGSFILLKFLYGQLLHNVIELLHSRTPMKELSHASLENRDHALSEFAKAIKK